MSQLHVNTISDEQKALLEKIGQLQLGTLVGGTALALQIGHRKSYDLDFVTQETINPDMVSKIAATLSQHNLSQRLSTNTQYTAFADQVKITLFQDPAVFLYPLKEFAAFNLAAVPDIFSSKLYVMGRRATWRDYVDVAVCLDQGVCNLKQGIAEAVQRYQISQRWILDPLSYFEDLEMTPIEWGEVKYSDDQIKQILVEEIKAYLSDE